MDTPQVSRVITVTLSDMQLSAIINALHDYYALNETAMPDSAMKLYSYLTEQYRACVLDSAEKLLYRDEYARENRYIH